MAQTRTDRENGKTLVIKVASQIPHQGREGTGSKLDMTWLKDDSVEDSDDLPEPQELAGEAILELEAALKGLKSIVGLFDGGRVLELSEFLPDGWVEVPLGELTSPSRPRQLPKDHPICHLLEWSTSNQVLVASLALPLPLE